MRAVMSVIWTRLLYSSIYGPSLHEDALTPDAFETLIDIFRLRLAALPQMGAIQTNK